MKFEQINKRFTETVAEWMAKGYTFNTATMDGHQGEIAKVDLTDGKEIIRINLATDSEPWFRVGEKGYKLEGVQLTVGRITDRITPNSSSTWDTAWTSRMEILTSETFYEIGRGSRDGSKWYGSRAEAMAQQDKQWERYKARFTEKRTEMTGRAFAIVLPYIRRQPRCKSVALSEIEKVTKVRSESRSGRKFTQYLVTARGKTYQLQ